MIILICIFITVLLMVYVFVLGHENEPIAYAAYLFSAYTLAIVCVRIIKAANRKLHAILHKNRFTSRYLTDISFKTLVMLYVSLTINLLYTLMKFGMGMYYHSVWFITISAYYLCLTVMRYLLLKNTSSSAIGHNLVSEYRKYRICGIILLFMNIALSGLVILILHENRSFNYAGSLIYIMAVYTFYSFAISVTNMIRYRKHGSPVLSAAKVLGFVSAMVSVLSLETAMIYRFDTTGDSFFRTKMISATGGAICLIIIVMSGYMIIHASRKLKDLRGE